VAGEGRPVLALLGRSDRRLSEALRLHVPSEVPPDPGGLLGLELEYSVRSVRGGRVHFGSLIHRLGLDGIALDPGDPNAYRCSWGGVITSDGAEAEIATPPVWTRPGFAARLQGWARTGEAELRRAVPRGIGLDGYSAHFSAAMPAKLNDRVCRLYAQTFAADLMLLTDRMDSPGLLLRPRPGRTELCGEFVENESLAAAAAFVAGTTRACAAAIRRPGARTALPPRLDLELTRAVHRYGWYVDRRAFGTDLHAASRRALLRRASGGTICAQSHLELAWAAARQALADDAAASDLQAADAMITGSLPLPAEQRQPDHAHGGQLGGEARFPLGGTIAPDTPHLGAHVRPGFTLRPVATTWDFTVFEASGPARSAYACIPRDSLPGFVAALEKGTLDDPIAAYLALTSRRRVLSAPEQTRRPGLYDQMGAPAGLLAPERDPQTGRHESGTPGTKRTLARPGKRNRQDREAPKKEQEAPKKEQESLRKARRFFPRAAAIGAVAAVLLAGAGVAIAVLRNANSPAVVSFQPAALVFPAVRVNTTITRSFTITNRGGSPATITGVSIGGTGRHDFSVPRRPDLLAAYRGGQAVYAAAPPPPCQRLVPPAQTCMITVVFTPSVPGSRTADLRIYPASPLRPLDITLSGTGTKTPPPPSRVSVTGIVPARGTAAGGTSVTITGSGFTASSVDTGISFGSTAAQFNIDSSTQITATSPPGTGTVHVTVTTPAGTSAATAADQFTYTAATTSPAITSAHAAAFMAGMAGTFTVTTTGNPTPAITEAGTLPLGVTFADHRDGTAVLSGTPPPGTSGTYLLTISAANGVLPDATQSFTLTVTVNQTPPAITSANATAFTAGTAGTFTVTTTGNPTPAITEAGKLPQGVTFHNGDGTAILSGTPAGGTAGTYPITFTAHNGVGADAIQPFTLTVNASADTDLMISTPANITVNAAGPTGASVSYTSPAVSDQDDTTTPAPACSPASGAMFAIGSTTVTCSASDSDDTPSTVRTNFTVTVNDTDLALAGVPADITTDATSPDGATVSYTAPTAVDEEPGASAICDHPSGSTFPIGTTTVTCSASDSDDTPERVSQSFVITVDGAAAQTSTLIATVQNFGLPGDFAATLVGELQTVQNDIAGGLNAGACNQLNVFISQSKTQSGNDLTASQAATLIAAAEQIQAVIGC
jgi:hypothetical protein